jgi:protein transport protein HofC
MQTIAKVLGILATAVALVVIGFVVFGLGGWLVAFLLSAVYGWFLLAYLHYRYVRQQELLHLLTTAAQANSPVGPALWAYLDDRPEGGLRDFLVAAVLFFVLPGYYWIWHRRHGFDRRLERLALLLESGMPLPQALRATPGVASRETVLAATVGEVSGRLATCLRAAPRWQVATVWLEAIPRLFYPVIVLATVTVVLSFQMSFIAPKYEKIFADFHVRLPESTNQMFELWRGSLGRGVAVVLVVFVLGLLTGLVLFSSRVRWSCPGVGRLYRMHVQSRVLRMLGILLEVDRPLPESLAVLADSGYFKGVARRRLEAARSAIEQGEALAPALNRFGLLPARMVALVQAAQRAQNVPWALTELGEHLAQRALRVMRRMTLVFFPAAVVGAGLLVAVVALAWFLPLVKLITELSR